MEKKFFTLGEIEFWCAEGEEESMRTTIEYLLDNLSIEELKEIIEIQAKSENYMACKAVKDKIDERRSK